MGTFDVLNPETEIFSHYFLEASAGTGKTFAIENIVPRLLLESEKPLLIAEILVVTFTRAATRELKSRIYQNLLKIKTALEEKEGGPPYLSSFLQEGEKNERAKRRIEEALCFFENSQIFTLHGFCLKILQEFAFETKFLLSFQDEEECSQNEKLKTYIKDFLRRGIDPQVLSSSQIKRVIQSTGKEVEDLCDAILKRLESGQKISTYPTAFQRWTSWNEALTSLPNLSQEELWHDYALIAPRLKASSKRKDQTDRFFKFIEQKGCSFKEWDCFLGEKEFFLEEIRFSASYKKKGPQELGLLRPGLFEELQRIFVPMYNSGRDVGIALLTLSNACRLHYEKGRLDLSHFNPDDLVITLQNTLLKDANFCKKVRERYQSVIIDEFQDTDPSQWDIFEILFFKESNTLTSLYLVGDPKQSIYAFRRADIYLYLRAASLLGEKSLAYLNTNFRSHPDLVDALNEFFSFNLPSKWMLLPFLKTSLEVRKVESKPRYPSALDGDQKGRLHFFLIEEEKTSGSKWPREEIEEGTLFPFLAKEIITLCKQKGYKLQQMAILVKDRYQAMRLQNSLKEYGIACLMQKSLDVDSSIAYEVMKDLLLALERPSSLSALKKVMGGALLCYSSLEIEGSLENPILQKAKEYFMEASFSFRKKGLGAFFQDFWCMPVKNGILLIQEVLSREDPLLYFDLRQLFQILLENCPQGFYSPQACLEFLEELRHLPLGSEVLKACAEEEDDQVQVMTLHKSKGLEFDIVFALGLCSRHTKGDEFISIRTEQGREIVASSQEKESLDLHLQELDAEKLRQLYVALTRGKERVYVPFILAKEPSQLQIGTASPIELLLGGIGLDEYVLEAVYQNIATFSNENLISYLNELKKRAPISYEKVGSSEVFVEKLEELSPSLFNPSIEPRLKSPDQFLLSFSALIQGKKEEGEKVYFEAPLEGSLPLGAETGTVIHSILEEVCKADLHRTDPFLTEIVEKASKNSCLEGHESILICLVQEAFEIPISSEGFCLRDVLSQDMRTEVEFLYPFQDSFLKGFIDLIFRYKGKYYILDWKTNYVSPQKEEYSLEKIKQCMDQSGYFLQASIYANALKKYLKLFEKKPFESLFGGAIYFFLRGGIPYLFQPDLQLGDSLWKSKES